MYHTDFRNTITCKIICCLIIFTFLLQTTPVPDVDASLRKNITTTDTRIFASRVLIADAVDIAIPGRGMPLVVSRIFSNFSPDNPTLGFGWIYNFEMNLKEIGDGNIIFQDERGGKTLFIKNNSSYVAESGKFYTLIKNNDGSYQLTTKYKIRHNFDSKGRILSKVDRNGNAINYEYTNGKLTTITNASGKSVTLSYDINGRLEKITDPAGRTVDYSYFNGDLTKVNDTGGFDTTYGYDNEHKMVNMIDKNGNTTSYTYDNNKRLTSITDPEGNKTTFDYLMNDKSEQDTMVVTNPKQGKSIYKYNSNFRVISITDPANNIREFDYYSNGLLKQERDPEGNITSYTYDSKYNLTSITKVSANGSSKVVSLFAYHPDFNRITSITDRLGHKTDFEYDAKGNLLKVLDNLSDKTLTTSYQYNPDGGIKSITNAKNKTLLLNYYQNEGYLKDFTDPANNKTALEYDTIGRVNRIISGAGTENIPIDLEYDNAGRMVKATYDNNIIETYDYDANDNLIKFTDGKGNKKEYKYNKNNQVIEFIEHNKGLPVTTYFDYDDNGNLSYITDAEGKLTIYDYNSNNQLIKTTYPDSKVESYSYDSRRNLKTKTDRNNNTITYGYDYLNRLISKKYPDTSTVQFARNPIGSITSTTDETGTTSYEYDELNRLINVTYPVNKVVGYEYDELGNRIKMTTPDNIIDYEYDDMSRLTKIADSDGKITTFEYDALGRRTKLIQPNGVATDYQYDRLSRLISLITQSSQLKTLNSFTYTYDNAGNRISMTTTEGDHSYIYDDINQITDVTYPDNRTVSYSFDNVGNRLSVTDSVKGNTDYTYINNTNRLQQAGDVIYQYDNNGNVISKTEGVLTTSFTYDYENRIKKITYPDSSTKEFTYDAFGRRVQSLDDNGTVNYLYDGMDVLQERDETDNLTAQYTFGPFIDEVLAVKKGVDDYFYQRDGLGSVAGITDAAEGVIENYSYDVYGNPIIKDALDNVILSSSIGNRYMFTGREFEEKSGLYYYRARWYGPETGRFLQEDPIGYRGGINLYGYVGNGPVNYVDPMGYNSEVITIQKRSQSYSYRQRFNGQKLQDLDQIANEHYNKNWHPTTGNYHSRPYYKCHIDTLDKPFKDPNRFLPDIEVDWRNGKIKIKPKSYWDLIRGSFEEVSPPLPGSCEDDDPNYPKPGDPNENDYFCNLTNTCKDPDGDDDDDIRNPDPTFIIHNNIIDPPEAKMDVIIISPGSSPGVNDTVDIPYQSSGQFIPSLVVYNEQGNIVKKIEEDRFLYEGSYNFEWDGRDNNGALLPDGNYRYVITGRLLNGGKDSLLTEGLIAIDNSTPSVSIDSFQIDQPEKGKATVIGSVQSETLSSYILELRPEGSTDRWITVNSSTEIVNNARLGIIDIASLTAAAYEVRLTATNSSGNQSRVIKNFVLDDEANQALHITISAISQTNYLGTANFRITDDSTDTWVEDSDNFPAGTTFVNNWEWNADIKYSGKESHTDPAGDGTHGHYFIHTDESLVVEGGDNIVQYVYIDPLNRPREIMLGFYTDEGDGEHRVYWGENLIQSGGINGTASSFRMGSMPPTGRWLRLVIPVLNAGIAGKDIKGMVFASFGGKVYWDKTTTSPGLLEKQKGSWDYAPGKGEVDHTDTTIFYKISKDANISLNIYDKDNKLVRTIFDEFHSKGSYQAVWDERDNFGKNVNDGTYYYQFEHKSGPVTSETLTLTVNESSITALDPLLSVPDSKGNVYRINSTDNTVEKENVNGDLILTITSGHVGLDNLNPIALSIDANDNLFILDALVGAIYKVNPNGYYMARIPEESAYESEKLNNPAAIQIDPVGDLYVADNNGTEIKRFAVARGAIGIDNITAKIRVPYENSLVQRTIPIIGTASAKDFKNYTVQVGTGRDPQVWSSLVTSRNEVIDTFAPLPGRVTLYGNLASWNTPGYSGDYTIRLIVRTNDGREEEYRVTVTVGKTTAISYGTNVYSNDGMVILSIPRGAIKHSYDIFSIFPVPEDIRPIDHFDNTVIGKVYEISPAGYKFTKPVTINFYYKDSALDTDSDGIIDIEENRLNLYTWDPVNNIWKYIDAGHITDENRLTVKTSELSQYLSYYAIMAGTNPPNSPNLYDVPSDTTQSVITVCGDAQPGIDVEVFVNGISAGIVSTDPLTGFFCASGINLSEGNNEIYAVAFDHSGNRSNNIQIQNINLTVNNPTAVTSLKFMESDFIAELTGDVVIGDDLFVKLAGSDSSPDTIDETTASVTSSKTDPSGITIRLTETGINTGIYRGIVRVGGISSEEAVMIGAIESQGETITVASTVDPTRFDTVQTRDIESPPAPVITSATHPSLTQDTFEADMGEWANMSDTEGATVTRVDSTSSSGNYSLELYNENEGGDFASYVRSTPFNTSQYPVVSFDYRIPEGVKVNLVAKVNGMLKEILFTDESKLIESFGEYFYRTIGEIKGIIADDNWHHAEFNLYNMLRNDDPLQTEYIVEELFLADYDQTGWMELVMGNNRQGATYYVDNFIITEGGKSDNNPQFTWSIADPGIAGYSYLLDKNKGSIPDEISEGISNATSFTNVDDGIWYFHVRGVDGAGNWGNTNHYRIEIDTKGPVADSPLPVDGSFSPKSEVNLRISDRDGSGVNPDTILLKFKDTTYDMNSGGMIYDDETETLTFSLWRVEPAPEPLVDGDEVEVTLLAADDYAGNPLESSFTWRYTVDYSQISQGTITMLTAEGGYTPAWSYDGLQVAFMSERSGNKDIWIIDSDDFGEINGSTIQLTLDEESDHHPAWSPIDNRIAFVSDRTGVDKIWIIDSNGTGLTQLTYGYTPDSHPTWSSDGTKIAFSRDGEIWTINVDGTDETQITNNNVEDNLDPDWSLDDSSIVFRKSLYSDILWTMDYDGKNEISLTASGNDYLPAWSRGSDKIIYVNTENDSPPSIWTMDKDGNNKRPFINNEERWWDTEPASSPVSDNLAFQSTRNGLWNIWVSGMLEIINAGASPDAISPNNDNFMDSADISFEFSMEGTVDIGIYDSNQNLVRDLVNQEILQSGSYIYIWDGKDNQGNVLSDGEYLFRIDANNGLSSDSINQQGIIRIDNTPPVITVTGVSDGETYFEEVTPIINIADDTLETTSVTLNGNPFVSGRTINEVGDYILAVSASDKVWNKDEIQINFSIKENNPPFIPSFPTPVDGATDIPVNTFLSWQGGDLDSDNTVTYDVYLDTTNPPSNKVPESQSKSTYHASDLLFNTPYYWKIVARDNHGAETEGPIWKFTTFSADRDLDNDGYTNEEEVTAESDPLNPDSIPGTTTFILHKGYNQVNFPAETMYYENIYNLMDSLGGSEVISSMQIYDPDRHVYDEVGYDEAGQYYGQNFALPSGEGLSGIIIYAKQDNTLTFTSKYCHTWDLMAGINLVGTPCVALDMTAYSLLTAIGNETVVSSIQRFNPETGSLETAGYQDGQPAGVDFPIRQGEGYFIYMKEDLFGFRP